MWCGAKLAGSSECGKDELDNEQRGVIRMMMNGGAVAGNWGYSVHLFLEARKKQPGYRRHWKIETKVGM